MKKPRRKKKILNSMLVFWITFAAVFLIGAVLMLLYQSTSGKEKELFIPASSETEGEFAFGTERIPEEQKHQKDPEEKEELPGKYADILADEEYCRENKVYGLEAASKEEVTLSFGGDILFDPAYSVMAKLLQRNKGIYDCISSDLLDIMTASDIMMLNNEFPYSKRGAPTPEKQFTFRAKPESAEILKNMGADIVSLANNHAYDYGAEALLDTFDTLEQIGMPYVGAGRNIEEASKPVYFIVNDIKIAYVSATQIERLDNPDTKEATDSSPGVLRCWNPKKLLSIITEAKENSDFVVVYIHWGTENTETVDWAQSDQAPKIAEAGADLIIGDHSHCLQPIQFIGDVPVIYSLGNFWFNSKTLDTCLVQAEIDENGLKSFQFIPAIQKDCTTSLAGGEEKERILSYMRFISPGVTIDENGYISK